MSVSKEKPQTSGVSLVGARCLVLGGGGFIGINLSNALAEAGAQVHAYGRSLLVADSFHKGVRWSRADFIDRPSLAAAIETADFVFHLVSSSTPSSANSDPIADVTDNLITTLHLLELCRRRPVRRIVFLSSGGTVYGPSQEIPLPETAPTNPITAYGIQKLAIEKYLAVYRHLYGLDHVVLRAANPFGPLQIAHKNQGVVAALMKRALSGEPLEIWGSGDVIRDFVYIDDLTRAILLATLYAGPLRLFNVGSGVGIKISTVVDDIERTVGRGPLRRVYLPVRSVDIPVNVLDIHRIGAEMGWRPQVAWLDGLRRTATWMSSVDPRNLA